MASVAAAGDREHDVVVIGAGLAGLSAAWQLRGRDVVVLEAENRVGGRLYSLPRPPYWLNLGAGVFSASPSPVRALIDELGLQTVEIPGSTTAVGYAEKVVASGPLETYPLRLPIAPRGRVSLMRAGAKIRVAVARYHRLARARPGEEPTEAVARVAAFEGDRSFSEFLGPLHPDAESLLRATAANRIGAELETISANGALGSFAYQWSGKQSLLNHNLRGGSALLPEAMARELGAAVVTGAEVTAVSAQPDHVAVTYRVGANPMTVRARAAVIATPADVTRQLVAELPAHVDAALASISYGPAVLAAMGTDEDHPMPYDDIYAMITPRERSTVFINAANSTRARGGREPGGSVLLYRGGEAARELAARDDSAIEAEFATTLTRLFPAARGHVREVVVQRWPRVVPFARPGRHLVQADLEADLGRIALAGDYLGSWGNMEAAVSSGIDAAARVRSALAPVTPRPR